MSAGGPLLVLGNLTVDDVVLPDGATRMGVLGGNSLYAALGARLWDVPVGIVARLGRDVVETARSVLARAGLGDHTVAVDGPAVRHWVLYEEDGARRFVPRTPAARYLEVVPRPADLPRPAVRDAAAVHVAAMPVDAAEALVTAVRVVSPAVPISLDTHEDYAEGLRDRLLGIARRAGCFLPSRLELSAMMGYDDPERALAWIAAHDPPAVVVVKLGADGCLVWERDGGSAARVEAALAAVVDETGAGDAFCGGFAAGVARGLAAHEAAGQGAASAAAAVEGFGSARLAELPPGGGPLRAGRDAPARPVALPAPDEDRRAIDVMLREIDTIPQLLADQPEALRAPVEALAASLVAEGVDDVCVVGCGDSYFAGLAAELAFRRRAGVRRHALHAMELSRYAIRFLPPRSLVVCVSYSGRVGRTIEAAVQARRHGHRVVALTGRADGPLAQATSESLLLSVPTLGFSPGTSTYVAMVASLLQLADALARARGRDGGLGTALAALPDAARETLQHAADPARAAAAELAGAQWVTFLGAGPSQAGARFGAAKLFEGPQQLGVATNLEEWAHEEYFVSGRGTPVVVVAPTGASWDRAVEILGELRFIEARAVLVSDAPAPDGTPHVLPLAAGLPEDVSPILAALPLSLLGFFIAEARGRRSYNFPSPEAEREHYETIHRATVGEPA